MESISRIKAHYGFTAEDAKNLKRLAPGMVPYGDDFVAAFYDHIKNFENAHKYLKDDEVVSRHKKGLKKWFESLFTGEYGIRYFNEVEKVGLAHVKIHLSAHYVNAAMHFAKTHITGLLKTLVTDEKELTYITRSIEKLLDINLDVITSSYMEEEKRAVFISRRLESFLIRSANRFSYALNLVLVLGLVVLGFMVLWLFFSDLSHLFTGDIEKGLLSTLGSLLMLWVVIELVDNEIKHLKGGKFAIKVFVSVALVAVIRKILVTTLSADAIEAQMSLVAALAVLGGVYWLISKVEN